MDSTFTSAVHFAQNTRVLRGDRPLSEEQMRTAAPSLFAPGRRLGCCDRDTYIPTIEILRALRKEGFAPFMVAQGPTRLRGTPGLTKHLIRLRYADQVGARLEAHEIILIKRHDEAGSYQMLAGVYRYSGRNELVVGERVGGIRIPRKPNVVDESIEAAYRMLDSFSQVAECTQAMKRLPLAYDEQLALAAAALALRFGDLSGVRRPAAPRPPAPITMKQLMEARRPEDRDDSLWATFLRMQENALRGGQPGRDARGRRLITRPVVSIDRGVCLNRALWTLAEKTLRLRR